jgi:hypothetical protein
MSGVAAVVVGATVYWASSPAPIVAPETSISAMSLPAALPERPQSVPADTARPQTPTQAPADPEDSTIAEYTAQKYQFLLDDLRYLEAGQLEQLRRALQARERLSGETNSAAQKLALARAEDQIRGMLHAADYSTYEMLRESDLELFKLNEYAGGISNVAPVSTADRESILKTKLAYKARFRQLLRDSGLQRDDLGAAEREYAYSVAARALEDFRRGYLLEVRQYLANDEQYALLSNYEATEFKAELAQLQSMVDTSPQGGS